MIKAANYSAPVQAQTRDPQPIESPGTAPVNYNLQTVTRKTEKHLMTEKRRKTPENAGKRQKTPKNMHKKTMRGHA